MFKKGKLWYSSTTVNMVKINVSLGTDSKDDAVRIEAELIRLVKSKVKTLDKNEKVNIPKLRDIAVNNIRKENK